MEPRVLIFDDATASVDALTEKELFQGIRAAAAGRTTIVISQRVTSIRWCDRVAVLDAGRIDGRRHARGTPRRERALPRGLRAPGARSGGAVSTTDEMALEEELARVPLRRKTWGRLVRYFRPNKGPLLLGLSIESFWMLIILVRDGLPEGGDRRSPAPRRRPRHGDVEPPALRHRRVPGVDHGDRTPAHAARGRGRDPRDPARRLRPPPAPVHAVLRPHEAGAHPRAGRPRRGQPRARLHVGPGRAREQPDGDRRGVPAHRVGAAPARPLGGRRDPASSGCSPARSRRSASPPTARSASRTRRSRPTWPSGSRACGS